MHPIRTPYRSRHRASPGQFLLHAGLIALCAMPAPVAAQTSPRPAPAFDTARVSRDIQTLASDAFEGRGPATPGEAKATRYIADGMKAAGLKPAGDKGSWFQAVPLLKADIVGQPTLAVTQTGRTTPLTQGQEIAVRAALTGQTSVAIAGAPLVFVGYGVRAPDRQWDDFKGVDLHGKIAVVLINDPDFEGGEGAFGGALMTYYGRWTYKYEEAARQGAAGAGLDFDAMKAAARRADFRPVELRATMDARYAVKAEVITSRNVAGIVPGTRYPAETVIYSAHGDHLGIGTPDAKGDRIYNGARDNASGVAALLELARAFGKAPRPERSVLFLAVTAEEKGLLGSEYYAANPLRPLATTAGVVNMDGPFGVARTKDFSISGAAKLDLLTMLTQEAAAEGRHYTPDARPEAGSFYRSDHFPFAKRGVPAISYNPGRDLVKGGPERGKALADAYIKDRYHQPADEYRPDWDMSSVPGDLTLLYRLGRRLADTHVWPNWASDGEFRAARDATQGDRPGPEVPSKAN